MHDVEEALDVLVEATLPNLIGVCVDARIVPAFHFDRQHERAEGTAEAARPGIDGPRGESER